MFNGIPEIIKSNSEVIIAKNLIDSMRQSIKAAKVVAARYEDEGGKTVSLVIPKGVGENWFKMADGCFMYPINMGAIIPDVSNVFSCYFLVIEKGSKFDIHKHDQMQKMIIIEGELTEIVSNTLLTSKSTYSIEPGVMHGFVANKPTVCIVVYVPPLPVKEE